MQQRRIDLSNGIPCAYHINGTDMRWMEEQLQAYLDQGTPDELGSYAETYDPRFIRSVLKFLCASAGTLPPEELASLLEQSSRLPQLHGRFVRYRSGVIAFQPNDGPALESDDPVTSMFMVTSEDEEERSTGNIATAAERIGQEPTFAASMGPVPMRICK
jgi:hypothetical protein